MDGGPAAASPELSDDDEKIARLDPNGNDMLEQLDPEAPEFASIHAELARLSIKHKAECGLGDDEMVMIAWPALLKVPSIRNSTWLHEALAGEERQLDG